MKCNCGRNFGLFTLGKCSVVNSGRNFGLFMLRKCSVVNSGRNFDLFVLGKCSVQHNSLIQFTQFLINYLWPVINIVPRHYEHIWTHYKQYPTAPSPLILPFLRFWPKYQYFLIKLSHFVVDRPWPVINNVNSTYQHAWHQSWVAPSISAFGATISSHICIISVFPNETFSFRKQVSLTRSIYCSERSNTCLCAAVARHHQIWLSYVGEIVVVDAILLICVRKV